MRRTLCIILTVMLLVSVITPTIAADPPKSWYVNVTGDDHTWGGEQDAVGPPPLLEITLLILRTLPLVR